MKNWIILIGLTISLLVASMSLAQSQGPIPGPLAKKPKPSQSNQTTSQNQYGTEQKPLIVKVLPSVKREAEADEEAYERHQKSINETRMAWATIWLAIVTTVLAIFTGYLWNATRKMVLSVQETAKQQLRAYIFGKGFNQGPNIFNDTIREYVFWVTWENLGLTPGIDVCSWINFKTFPIDEKHEILFAASREIEPAPLVMGPKATSQTAFISVPLETMMQAWKNKTKILLWSRVEYRDKFDSKIIRHHEQCVMIHLIRDPSIILPKEHPPCVTFIVYGSQNSAE